MENLATFRIELDMSAYKVIHQLATQNRKIEDSLQRGIQMAIDELSNDDNLAEIVKQKVKKEILDFTNKSILSWDIQMAISKKVGEKLSHRIDEYAEKVINQIII